MAMDFDGEHFVAAAIREHVFEAVQGAHVGVGIADAKWRFEWVNQAFADLLGGSPDGIIGNTPYELAEIGVRPSWVRSALRTLARGDVWRGEIRGPSKWGKPVHVLASVYRVSTSLRTEAFTMVVHDIREEANLREQLIHAQRMQAMGQLAGGVAHAFNNALQTMGNALHLLRPLLPGDARVRELDTVIERTLDSASDIAGQLLAFARQRRLDARAQQLGKLVEHLEPLLRTALPEDVTLELDLPLEQDDPVVEVDSRLIEQVLLSLCLNASEATRGSGSVKVRITADFGAREAVLEVLDDGPGIAPENRERIFEPFFTTDEEGHAGLGLAMAEGITAQLGGSIGAQNRPEGGAHFTVRFPLAVAGKPESAGQVIHESSSGGLPIEGKRVLLVEDEDDLRRTLLEVLDDEGFETRGAPDGPSALRFVTEEGWVPDCLVTDLRMPGMSGQELAKRLRTLHTSIAVVMASGYHPDSLPGLERCFFLEKPFRIGQLVEAVRSLTLERVDGKNGGSDGT